MRKEELKGYLLSHGYDMEDSDLEDAVDYIEQFGYSKQEWFEDTKMNYPEMLK